MNPGPGPVPPQPSTEQLRDYLTRRKRELSQQISALRGQIAPKEQELAEVDKAMTALGMHSGPLAALLFSAGMSDPQGALSATPDFPLASLGSALAGDALHPSLTIKQMIIRAFNDHFHGGATPAELRDYIRTAYGRDVDRNSISPQLARLRDEGFVEQMLGMLNEGRWQLKGSGEPKTDRPGLTARQQRFYGGDDT